MQVSFQLNYAETKMGQNLFIIGNRDFFGMWDVSELLTQVARCA